MLVRLLVCLFLVLVTAGIVPAQQQQQQQQQQQTVAQPTEEQKRALKEDADRFNQTQQAADSARDKFTIRLLNIMAELGLKPSETKLEWDQQGLPVFIKLDPVVAPKDSKDEKKDVKKDVKDEKKNP